ncbi:MAG: response regulator [Bdellovibrionota bacterium]
MIVEDENDIAVCLQSILAFEGYQVITAANGNEALKFLAEGLVPDLILSDLCMPQLDGYGFTRALRKMKGFEKIAVILMSGSTFDEGRLEANSWNHFMEKPLVIDELKTTVKELLPCDSGPHAAPPQASVSTRQKQRGSKKRSQRGGDK